jgi:putative redox protein
MYARNRAWGVEGLAVDVDYDTEARPRRFEIAVELPDGLSSEQVGRLERVAESCPIRRALEGGFSFEERVLAAPRAA